MIDNRRRALIALTALLAVMEVIDAFFIEEPVFAVGFAVVLLLLAFWALRTRRLYPDVLIGLLAVMEFLSVLFVYPNADDPPADGTPRYSRSSPSRRRRQQPRAHTAGGRIDLRKDARPQRSSGSGMLQQLAP